MEVLPPVSRSSSRRMASRWMNMQLARPDGRTRRHRASGPADLQRLENADLGGHHLGGPRVGSHDPARPVINGQSPITRPRAIPPSSPIGGFTSRGRGKRAAACTANSGGFPCASSAWVRDDRLGEDGEGATKRVIRSTPPDRDHTRPTNAPLTCRLSSRLSESTCAFVAAGLVPGPPASA